MEAKQAIEKRRQYQETLKEEIAAIEAKKEAEEAEKKAAWILQFAPKHDLADAPDAPKRKQARGPREKLDKPNP